MTTFALACESIGLPPPEEEFRFHPVRRWRWDYAWPELMLAVEIDGGLYVAGRHSRGAGREKDLEKVAHGLILGWTVFTFSTRMVNSGVALTWLSQWLANRSKSHV